MAATIRLARHGAKKRPFYRIVVADTRAPRDNARLDQVGTYDPRQEPPHLTFEAAKLKRWLSCGAQPSQTVAQLIKRSGVLTAAEEGQAAPAEESEAAPVVEASASQPASAPAPDPGETQT